MNSKDQPLTRGDLDAAIDTLTETLRGIETSLLRAFHAYAQGVDIRLARVEADVRNVDTSTMRRLEALEQRVLELELRLPPSAGFTRS